MENKPEVILIGNEPEPITLLITNHYPLEPLVEPFIINKGNGKTNNFIVKHKVKNKNPYGIKNKPRINFKRR